MSCCQLSREHQFAFRVSEEVKSAASYLDQAGGEAATRGHLQAYWHTGNVVFLSLLMNLFKLVSQLLEILFLIAKALEGLLRWYGLHWFIFTLYIDE